MKKIWYVFMVLGLLLIIVHLQSLDSMVHKFDNLSQSKAPLSTNSLLTNQGKKNILSYQKKKFWNKNVSP